LAMMSKVQWRAWLSSRIAILAQAIAYTSSRTNRSKSCHSLDVTILLFRTYLIRTMLQWLLSIK
jgi:hypothetical protein